MGFPASEKGKMPCEEHNTDRKVFDVASRQCEQQVENNYVNTLLNAIGTRAAKSDLWWPTATSFIDRNCRKNVHSWAAQYFCCCSWDMLFSSALVS